VSYSRSKAQRGEPGSAAVKMPRPNAEEGPYKILKREKILEKGKKRISRSPREFRGGKPGRICTEENLVTLRPKKGKTPYKRYARVSKGVSEKPLRGRKAPKTNK